MDATTRFIVCPRCQQGNPSGALRCESCGLLLQSDMTATNAGVDTDWSRATRAGRAAAGPRMELEVGSVLADRYEIRKLLGEGGMGAVYQAQDRELDRLVALKVIRPELAGQSSVLQRFKQELILARKITHRNTIRIFDLGVADGLRFITMEYVEGRDLSTLLEERPKFPPAEAVAILRQVCAALEAAHSEGVVHRDLKPQNIMIEASGRVCVMDFGLARSLESQGMTQTGAIMGTPAYMSPEQAKGIPADARSDLFSLGIIAYQILTGHVPFKGDTALSSMLLRTQGPPPAPVTFEPSLPPRLNDIVLKTVAIPLEARYQSATALNKDLSDWQEGIISQEIVPKQSISQEIASGPVAPIVTPTISMLRESHAKKWIAISVAAALAIAGGIYGVNRYLTKPAGPVAPMTVIIADFDNHTGDPVFTGTLESTLKLTMEGASFINAYDRTKMRDLGLPAVKGALDASKAQLIAASQGLNTVVSGSVDHSGSSYQISLRAVQTVTGKVIVSRDETAADKGDVLYAVIKLGTAVRKALGDVTSESTQRFSAETLSAASLEAVHEYALALNALSVGQFEEGKDHFSKAVDLDPNFGLAYAGMAIASNNLGRRQDAENYIREALKHIDHMTERERFRTRAALYALTGDEKKCVSEYDGLLEKYPADTGAHNNVAFCLTQLRNMSKAVEEVQRAVAILPKRATYRANLALYLAYGGDFDGAAKEAANTLQLNPSFFQGFRAQAFADMGQEQVAKAADVYRSLEKIDPSKAAAGFADLAIFEGRFQEATNILEKGAASDSAAGRSDDAADKLSALAFTHLLRGQLTAALSNAKSSLDLSKAVKTRFLAARIYVEAGEAAKAQELAKGLLAEPQLEPQAYGKVIEGEAALKSGDGRGAVKLFAEANNLLDTWIGHFDLGRADLDISAFNEAESEFERCLKRRGEALALFLDEVPTYGYFPAVYYYQGRVREALKNAGSAESYKKYLAIRSKAGEDPRLAEIGRRMGQ